MEEKCPVCDNKLILLGSLEKLKLQPTKQKTYKVFRPYFYWCKYCEKPYVKKHKSWLESWKKVANE